MILQTPRHLSLLPQDSSSNNPNVLVVRTLRSVLVSQTPLPSLGQTLDLRRPLVLVPGFLVVNDTVCPLFVWGWGRHA